ncbi:LETM1 domain-containing protein LETM2, mitochondrial [Manis javanica]|nr:LETM1 domain-containing protein LETM2, mitochondrial [Manis javanica]
MPSAPLSLPKGSITSAKETTLLAESQRTTQNHPEARLLRKEHKACWTMRLMLSTCLPSAVASKLDPLLGP